jgi:hypothetical protein
MLLTHPYGAEIPREKGAMDSFLGTAVFSILAAIHVVACAF